MTTQTEDGGSAFPVTRIEVDDNGQATRVSALPGMTLRDWFAGMALQGMLANPDFNGASDASVAGFAFRQSDAMLAERERKEDA